MFVIVFWYSNCNIKEPVSNVTFSILEIALLYLLLSVSMSAQSFPTLCGPMDYMEASRPLCPWNFPGKTTGWVAIFFSRGSSRSRNRTWVSCISCMGRQILYHERHLSVKPISVCCCSAAQSCLTLCDPMHCRAPGVPVLHHLLGFAQTHVHWVGDTIQSSHPLSPAFPAFNLSQYLGLF